MSITGDLIEVKLAFPTIVYKKITNSYVDAISNNKHVLSELHIEDRDIEIINNLSQIIFKKSYNSENISVPVSDFPDGIYFLKIKNGIQSLIERLIIIH